MKKGKGKGRREEDGRWVGFLGVGVGFHWNTDDEDKMSLKRRTLDIG